MKNDRRYRLPCKLAAILLAVLSWSLTVLSAIALITVTVWAGSENSVEAACKNTVSSYEYAYLDDLRLLIRNYDLKNDDTAANDDALHAYVDDENYYAVITVGGKTVFNNYQNEPYRIKRSLNTSVYYDDGSETTLRIVIYLKTEPVKRDLYAVTLTLTRWVFTHRTGGIIFCLFGLILSISLTAFLCCVTARRAEDPEAPVCNHYSRLPTDLSALLLGGTAAFLILLAGECSQSDLFPLYIFPAFVVAAVSLGLFCVLDIAARVKTHTFWRNTLIWRLCVLIVRLCRTLAHGIAALPLIPKTVGAVLLLLFAELIGILLLADRPRALFSVWIAEKLLLVPLLLWFFSGLRRIREGIARMANGELACRLPTQYLAGDVKAAADDLNRIDEGLQKAVEARLKSERLRTELITNVSHDIKTPLTSIISYVDLIKKEEPENEQIKAYIDVLDRQSIRLKKLIEDLVEASKASTGNLTVDLSPCDLGTMLTQTIGEYTERFEHAGLTPVLHLPKEPIVISADSRHLWRIFDNLMNNICKYALSGTRVYFDLLKNGNQAICIFRNISRSELTVSPDELSERFVRGDSSRNTEGSGLGLSIAASLTALQKGRLDISTDGDLFKVILTFSALNDEKG